MSTAMTLRAELDQLQARADAGEAIRPDDFDAVLLDAQYLAHRAAERGDVSMPEVFEGTVLVRAWQTGQADIQYGNA